MLAIRFGLVRRVRAQCPPLPIFKSTKASKSNNILFILIRVSKNHKRERFRLATNIACGLCTHYGTVFEYCTISTASFVREALDRQEENRANTPSPGAYVRVDNPVHSNRNSLLHLRRCWHPSTTVDSYSE